MRNMHRWEQLRPEEFYAEMERAPVVYWGCGPMEDHGLQNALGLDACKAYEICLRAAAISGGIVFPMVSFAPAGNPPLSRDELRARGPLFPPSLWASRELCERIYSELFESMSELGFRVCLVFAGHGPARTMLMRMVEQCGGRVGEMRVFATGATLILDVIHATEDGVAAMPGRHGGMWETSANMALNPDYVDLSRTRHIDEIPIPSQLKNLAEADVRAIEQSSVDFGERILQTAAERMAAKARELLGAS